MKHYQKKRLRPLRILAMGLRFIARLLQLWPLLLSAMLLISPITPHLRWNYHPENTDSRQCDYMGVRGLKLRNTSGCPFIAFMSHPPLLTNL